MTDWQVIELDTISYQHGLELQEEYWQKALDGGNHTLLLLEHFPVITMGRRTDASHLLLTEEELEEKGISLFHVNRGGSATYHGPGQLVGYVICKASRLGGIHELVNRVLAGVQEIISSYKIDCIIDYENPGVWTTSDVPRKLAAVGMQNKMGYTMHGFAINVHLPLSGFAAIVPCGLALPVTTMSIELGRILDIQEVKQKAKEIMLKNLSRILMENK
ncbi:MAG: lipoyl(octanoyl) transferase LipB [Candidatus Heimdallarchaeota archaeon]|nr:lipoyl(octanoyl) transferase LipB [Candidatus Heimdallarchaeota archaeon]